MMFSITKPNQTVIHASKIPQRKHQTPVSVSLSSPSLFASRAVWRTGTRVRAVWKDAKGWSADNSGHLPRRDVRLLSSGRLAESPQVAASDAAARGDS